MSGVPLTHDELMRLFEAARWAPSWGNSQPWRFVWCARDTPHFERLFGALDQGNQEWVVRAAVIVLVCSKNAKPNGKPLPTHAFDTGAAWMALALQGTAMGLVVHAMGGFDSARARAACNVPDDVVTHCVVAIGRPGDAALLSEKQRAAEHPNDREPLEVHVTEGAFAPQ